MAGSFSDIPSGFTEMLRSFVSLAKTLNLSHTVEELGISRQTVRRHVRHLEVMHGGPLIELVDRNYVLTELGSQVFPSARAILERSVDWMRDDNDFSSSQLSKCAIEIGKDQFGYVQQHPVNNIWKSGVPLIRRMLEKWIAAEGQLYSPAMEKIRPYLLVCRRYNQDWLFAEIGEKSSFASWMGQDRAQSSISKSFFKGEPFSKMDQYLLHAYDSVVVNGDVWYDHVSLMVRRTEAGSPQLVNYQRIVASCDFPDGSPCVAVLAARTDRVEIPSRPRARCLETTAFEPMEFDI